MFLLSASIVSLTSPQNCLERIALFLHFIHARRYTLKSTKKDISSLFSMNKTKHNTAFATSVYLSVFTYPYRNTENRRNQMYNKTALSQVSIIKQHVSSATLFVHFSTIFLSY